MKKLFLALILFLSMTNAYAATPADAEKFAKSIADQLVADVMQSKAPVEQKRIRFEEIFVTNADMDMIVRFVLGRSFKSAPPEKISEFKTVFIENFVLTWADRFNSYSGESVTFTNVRQNKNEFWTTSQINIPGTEKPIDVLWRLREKNGVMKVVDLVAEGVSMLQNYRNEYASVLQQNNGDVSALIRQLEKKNASLSKTDK